MTITFDSLCDAIGIAAKEAALHLEGNGRSLTVLKSHTELNSERAGFCFQTLEEARKPRTEQ